MESKADLMVIRFRLCTTERNNKQLINLYQQLENIIQNNPLLITSQIKQKFYLDSTPPNIHIKKVTHTILLL